MKKQLSAIFAATIFAFAIAGCGTETKDTGNGGGYYPIPTPTPSPTVSPTPTPTPTPTPSPTQDVDTSVKTIYYQATGGNITDICDDGNQNFYFNVSAGTNSSIMKYDQNKDEVTTVVTGLTKPFSVAYAMSSTKADGQSEHLFYTTREGSGGHVWDYDINTKAMISYDSATNGVNLIDPTYIKAYNYNMNGIFGVDSSQASRFCFALSPTHKTYVPSSSSKVLSVANFFDSSLCFYSPDGSSIYQYILAGSMSSTGGIGVFSINIQDGTITEVSKVSDTAPYCSATTSGKFVTTVCDFPIANENKVIYSSFQEAGKLNIYVYNPTEADELLISDGSIPAAYDIARSTVNPNIFYFTACGTSGSQGVYLYNSATGQTEKVAGPTTAQPMLAPARIMLTGKQGLPTGYEEIIWTCGGGYFDTSTREFNGAQGAVYSKIHYVGTAN